MHEILEDHLVEPSELTASDRPVEIPTAGAEKDTYWDISAMNDHTPGTSQFLMTPRLDPLDSSLLIICHKQRRPK